MKVDKWGGGLGGWDVLDRQLASDYLLMPSQLWQRRVGQSMFLRHYYKPYLRKAKEKVLKAMEPMTTHLIQRTLN